MPAKLNTGITVVGKGAYIPANVSIGRNVLIAAEVSEDAFGGLLTIPSGASIHREGVSLPPKQEEITPDQAAPSSEEATA
jgi:UDP-3-O-[3-hydroxymyristoyl] glucosamine N-acyltransferase